MFVNFGWKWTFLRRNSTNQNSSNLFIGGNKMEEVNSLITNTTWKIIIITLFPGLAVSPSQHWLVLQIPGIDSVQRSLFPRP